MILLILGPKVEIKTDFFHNTVVKTPVQLGTVLEEHVVSEMSRLDGKVMTRKTITEKPVLAILNTNKNVITPHTTTVDLLSGKIITGAQAPSYHGLK